MRFWFFPVSINQSSFFFQFIPSFQTLLYTWFWYRPSPKLLHDYFGLKRVWMEMLSEAKKSLTVKESLEPGLIDLIIFVKVA
jgi:hypothetical protein